MRHLDSIIVAATVVSTALTPQVSAQMPNDIDQEGQIYRGSEFEEPSTDVVETATRHTREEVLRSSAKTSALNYLARILPEEWKIVGERADMDPAVSASLIIDVPELERHNFLSGDGGEKKQGDPYALSLNGSYEGPHMPAKKEFMFNMIVWNEELQSYGAVWITVTYHEIMSDKADEAPAEDWFVFSSRRIIPLKKNAPQSAATLPPPQATPPQEYVLVPIETVPPELLRQLGSPPPTDDGKGHVDEDMPSPELPLYHLSEAVLATIRFVEAKTCWWMWKIDKSSAVAKTADHREVNTAIYRFVKDRGVPTVENDQSFVDQQKPKIVYRVSFDASAGISEPLYTANNVVPPREQHEALIDRDFNVLATTLPVAIFGCIRQSSPEPK
ncbi:MAG: hypothetical protein AAB588_04220 [Patescibacteria group bacterium]